jgi:arginyl-tRNA synthetase
LPNKGYCLPLAIIFVSENPMNIENILAKHLTTALAALFAHEVSPESILLQATKKEFEGDVTLVVFPYIKSSKKSPEETARLLGDYLVQQAGIVEKYNVVKGFLNLSIKANAWVQTLITMRQTDSFGKFATNGKAVMVEYSSPNTNKPLHLGHLRNNFLGFSISQILEASGYKVLKANLVNDRGIHICKSMLAYQKFGQGETPQTAHIKGDKLVGNYYVRFEQENKKQAAEIFATYQAQGLVTDERSEEQHKEKAKMATALMQEAQAMLRKWEENEPNTVNLWKKMNGWVYDGFHATYNTIGVTFDKFYYESDTYLLGKDVVEEGLRKGIFFKKDNNSVWIDLKNEGLDEKLVLRGDGTSVYITQDIGTADLKYKDFPMQQSIYVIGNEQEYHMKVLKLIMQKLNRPYADGMFHLSYGMVELPSGKMKSREGTVVDADDLIDELIALAQQTTQELGKVQELPEGEKQALYKTLGLGALKYFLLKVDPKKTMLFNPEESLALTGDTATYIQYTHARIASIIRTAQTSSYAYEASHYENLSQIAAVEQELIQCLGQFPSKSREAAEGLAPSILANYAYELAKCYGKFFHDCPIFKAETDQLRSFRIALSAQTGLVIKDAMALLGIEVPNRM